MVRRYIATIGPRYMGLVHVPYGLLYDIVVGERHITILTKVSSQIIQLYRTIEIEPV